MGNGVRLPFYDLIQEYLFYGYECLVMINLFEGDSRVDRLTFVSESSGRAEATIRFESRFSDPSYNFSDRIGCF